MKLNTALRLLRPPALIGLAFAATILVGLVVRASPLLVALDTGLFHAINGLSCGATPTSPVFAVMWTGFNHTVVNYIVLYGISAAYVLLRKREQWPRLLFVGLAVAGLGSISKLIVGQWAWAPRPFTITDACILYPELKEIWSQFSSYPSGHARETAAEIAVLITFWRRIWPAGLFYLALLCFSRVYIGVHFPSDVLAGALLGWAIGWVAFLGYDTYLAPLLAKWRARAA